MADDKRKKQRRNRISFLKLNVSSVAFILLTVFLPQVMLSVQASNPCTASQFWVFHADGTTSCVDCESCPQGHGLSHECGKNLSSNAMVTCIPCQPGKSFSANYGTSRCRPCSAVCSEDQVVIQTCTTTTDVKCAKKCKSGDRYYDDFGGCKACSKCCGDEDVVETECKEKLGSASNMICSFHSNMTQCGSTTTASVPVTATTIRNSLSSVPFNLSTPLSTSAAAGMTSKESTVTQKEQSSLHLTKTEDSENSANGSYLSLSVIATIVIGVLLVTAGCVTYLCYRCLRRKCSVFRSQHAHDHEMGIIHDSVNGLQQTKVLLSGEDVALTKLTKSEKRKLGTITPSDSSEPLLIKESCQDDTQRASKLLCSLLEDNSSLERICECLDTTIRGYGNYKEVAQHYGHDYYRVKSVFEKHDGGPSRALIESLATTHSDLTVGEFAEVVKSKTKRNDVIKRLKEYDSS